MHTKIIRLGPRKQNRVCQESALAQEELNYDLLANLKFHQCPERLMDLRASLALCKEYLLAMAEGRLWPLLFLRILVLMILMKTKALSTNMP